jgi:Glucodextranase, domain B
MNVARRWLAVGLCAPALAVAAGCGSSSQQSAASGPRSVQVSLTAPTDGATVNVDRLKVFGTVTPAGAAVSVGGHRAGHGDGTFQRWIGLRHGANRIRVRASAPGYEPTTLEITVTSGGATALTGAPAPRPSGFVARANAVCGDLNGQVLTLPPIVNDGTFKSDFAQIIALNDSAVRRLRALTPPPASAARYAQFLAVLSSEVGRARQILADAQQVGQGDAGQRIANAQKLVGAAGWLGVSARQSDAMARQLGLSACAADVAPGA